MNGLTINKRYRISPAIPALMALLLSPLAFAQVPIDEDGNPITAIEDGATSVNPPASSITADSPLTPAELEELVGPVALYPDDLLAIVLPASTYPLEIVQAARFLEQLETDKSLEPDESWDDSVVALLNYPEVLQMMNEDIDWTWRLGEAVIAQQSDVIAAVEAFRDRAYAAGNLKTDEHQTVTVEDGTIEIVPIDDEIIYVPYYEPEEVVVYPPRRVYYYYPDPYPVYYYPYPHNYHFHSGYFWGVTTAFNIGWHNHYLHVYHPSYWGHPYYGYTYFDYYWYRQPSISVYNTWYVNNTYYPSRYRYRDGDHWRPRHRAGSRPDEPRVNNYYYPPGSADGGGRVSREGYRASNRDSLRVADDGRMELNLRERQGAPRRTDVDDNRGSARSGTAATANRRSEGFAGNSSRAINRNDNADRVGNAPTASRRSEGFASNSSRTTSRSSGTDRTAGTRPEIRFRDRSGDGAISANRRPSTSSSGGSNRAASTTRPPNSAQSSRRPTDAGANTRNSRASVSSESRAGSSLREGFSAPSVRGDAAVGRAPTPTLRQGSANRPSYTPNLRQSSPSVSSDAPSLRQSAPPSRSYSGSSNPSRNAIRQSTSSSRSSAGSRSTPSSASGSRSAPSSAPGINSSSRSSGASGRRSSGSRPRNQD